MYEHCHLNPVAAKKHQLPAHTHWQQEQDHLEEEEEEGQPQMAGIGRHQVC
jgi:hypothetical protein